MVDLYIYEKKQISCYSSQVIMEEVYIFVGKLIKEQLGLAQQW